MACASLHVFRCLVITLWVVNWRLQLGQLCSLMPLCTFWWFFRLWFVVKVWVQRVHANLASLVLRASLALIPAVDATLRRGAPGRLVLDSSVQDDGVRLSMPNMRSSACGGRAPML